MFVFYSVPCRLVRELEVEELGVFNGASWGFYTGILI